MSRLRYLVSRPLAWLFWALFALHHVALWAATWVAVWTWTVRGRDDRTSNP